MTPIAFRIKMYTTLRRDARFSKMATTLMRESNFGPLCPKIGITLRRDARFSILIFLRHSQQIRLLSSWQAKHGHLAAECRSFSKIPKFVPKQLQIGPNWVHVGLDGIGMGSDGIGMGPVGIEMESG